MKNRDDALLHKIIEYCNEAEAPMAIFGDDIDSFSNNIVFRNACCMPVMQIGELCKLISEDLRNTYNEVDWHGWCGIRDIFAHQYTNLDYVKTWSVLHQDLPKMKTQCAKILESIDASNIERIQKIIDSNHIEHADALQIYKKISTNTGISLNAFSDDQLEDYINNFAQS